MTIVDCRCRGRSLVDQLGDSGTDRISKDEGQTWTHARTLFRSHVPAVGLLDPGPVTGQVGLKSYVGELPRDYATADYPNIHFHGDEIWFHYDRNPRFIGGAYWTLRILPVGALYE